MENKEHIFSLPKMDTFCHFWMVLLLSLMFLRVNSQDNINLKDTSPPVRYMVTTVGANKGLNSSDISALFQDKDGFIWVGNQPGISRFDGYEFKNFTRAGNTFLGEIHSIAEDATGTLWIGGVNGLFYYKNGQFHVSSLRKMDVKVIHFNADNNAWIGGLGFIPFVLSPSDLSKLTENQEIEIHPIVSNEQWEKKIGPQRVWDIDTDGEGKTWLGVYNRRVSFDGKQLQVYWKDDTVSHHYSAVAAFDNDNVFWGSEETGLIFQEKNQFKTLTNSSVYIFASNDSSIYFLSTQELLEWKDGKLKSLHTFRKYNNLYYKEMIIDREGNFWIGAEGNLLKLTPSYFKTWSFSDEALLHSNHSIAQLPNGEIIVGSSKEKILRYKNDAFVPFTTIDVPRNSLTGAIYPDENGWIWYGTSMRGIILERNGAKESYTEKEGLGNKGQYFFYKSKDGELWSGGDGGISHIVVATDGKISFENYMVGIDDKELPLFRNIIESPDKSIWAVSDKGLFVLKNKKLQRWSFPSPATPYPIITGSAIDETGQLWLSTQGEGLWQCSFNIENEPVLIHQWSELDGLSTDVILDVHVDQLNRIWVAGQNGICSLNFGEASPSIRCFDQIDGWFKAPFPHCQLLESTNGMLWAVGLTEISSFPLYQLPKNKVAPFTFISSVELFDGKEDIYPFAKNAEGDKQLPKDLILPHNKNFLSFHFTTTSFTHLEKNKFKYKLEGLDKEWNIPVANRKVLYPGLQPGNYTFKVLAANNDGVYGEKIAAFSFEILSPWYGTWWAYISYVLILLILGNSFYRFQLDKKMALAESTRLRDINQLKNSLYTNITHEFRTPLTVILGMANALKTEAKKENFKAAEKPLTMIYRNGRKLLDLVNEMLDLAKLESGNMELQLVQTNIVPFVRYLSESFHSLAGDKNIDLNVYSEIEVLEMDIDANKLAVIISNLLSNAIKFTANKGKITVHLNKVDKDGTSCFILKVKDNGMGISKEERSTIFNKFYQINSPKSNGVTGTGIGLSITQELVVLMNGTIRVESILEKGSMFIIELPISNAAIKTKNIEITANVFTEVATDINKKEESFFKEDSDLPLALIIEDNIDVADYLKTCLHQKYKTIHAIDGAIGIALAYERIPDIIISDVMMPEKDGFEVCHTLKTDERTDHIPIILLTAKVSIKDRIKGLSHGADAYLAKPFIKEELFTRLDQLLLLRKKMLQKIPINSFSQIMAIKEENPETKFLQKIIKVISEEMNKSTFGPVQLAQKMNLSESQIYRKLKAITNTSTGIYIRSIRLQKAKELLLTSEKTVSEVGYEVGFNDPSWFSRAFKNEFGLPPNDICKKLKKI